MGEHVESGSEGVLLELGCGNAKTEGAIGADINLHSQADLVCQLNRIPWPFRDRICRELRCFHVIEHLDDTFAVMAEIHRICRPNARVKIRCPHFSCLYSYRNPTHVHHFALDTFDYWLADSPHVNYPVAERFRLIRKNFEFGRALLSQPARKFAEHFPHQYEKHFAFIFPCQHIYVELEAVKH